MSEFENIIKALELQPHPEGGYFKEMYRSSGSISKNNLDQSFTGSRNYSTAIYFLLISDTFSAFHRIKQDEIWHFYKGTAIKLHTISENGKYTEVIIGNDIEKNEFPQYVVSANDWFAAEVIDKDSFALVGCTVAPGFDFEDFDLPSREELLEKFPMHSKIISRLSR